MTTPSTPIKEITMSKTQLSITQTEVLKAATRRADGNLEPLPANLRGGARKKVIDGLLSRELVSKFHYPDHVEYTLTDAGYAAVGKKRKAVAPVTAPAKAKAAQTPAEAQRAPETPATAEGQPLVRQNSKQATVIEMLRRPEGATVDQVMAVTGWQRHTVRGTFSGALKKKLGLALTSAKIGDARVYRIG
jgi:hypothetical protein